MKFWELISIFAEERKTLESLFRRPAWAQFAEVYRDYAKHVSNQNRNILDAKVPDDLCREALSLSSRKYVVFNGQLAADAGKYFGANQEVLTAVEAFDRFGGSALEEVCEKGAYI